VFLGAAALLLLLLAVFAYALARSQDQQRHDLEKRFNDRAEVAASVNEAIFSLASSQVKSIDAATFGGPTISAAALTARAAQSGSPYSAILSSDGKVLAATAGAPKNLGSGPHVKKALTSKQTEYSSLMPGPGGMAIVESATAFPTKFGVRVDVTATSGDFLSQFLNSFLSRLPAVGAARSYVIDPERKLIATPGAKTPAGTPLPDKELSAAVTRKSHGAYAGSRYFTSASIAGTPWRIVLSAAQSDLYSSVQSTVPWIIFGAFVLMAALGLFLLRRVLVANTELERADLSRRHALEINDNVVQRLVLAKYALDRGATEMSQQKLAETLRETQQLVTSLLEEKEIAPGSLRREAPSSADGPPEPPPRPR
jgi:hypothetical protein